MSRFILAFFCTLLCAFLCDSQQQYGCLIPTKQGLILGTCPYTGHGKNCPKPVACGFKYPKHYSIHYECYVDFDCDADHKCCDHPCFIHKVCLKAT